MFSSKDDLKGNFLDTLQGLNYDSNASNIFLTSTNNVNSIYAALAEAYSEEKVIYLASNELLPYDFFSAPSRVRAERINALSRLLEVSNKTLVCSIQTALGPCPNPSHVAPINNLRVGDSFIRNEIVKFLENNGYRRSELVTEAGEYSLRGNVVDLFLTSNKNPIRIEVFDETIESLRYFDPSTQLTIDKIEQVQGLPAYEYPRDDNGASIFKKNWRSNFDTFEGDSESFKKVMDKQKVEGIEMYLPLFYEKKATLLPYLKGIENLYIEQKAVIEASEFKDLVEIRYEEYRHDLQRPLLPPKDLYINLDEIKKNCSGSIEIFEAELKEIQAENSHEAESLDENVIQSLHTLPEKGDLVVHLSHGIGKFLGLIELDSFVGKTECLEIEYSEKSKVFVPIENMNLVSKYFGPEDRGLDSLGSAKWSKRKEKALQQTFDTAAELLEIQAKRASKKGYKYSVPENEFKEFSSKFPYQETFDQERTINEVVEDLSSYKTMDRLVCGEVGFGKTEVAMRAAFIASYNSKQTCILVPTTLLATQHYKSFLDRFSETSVNIALVTRNVKPKEKIKIFNDLESGLVDIVIGTHAVIQGTIEFKDLGLLIIDEEHRFGVRQKEKIKSIKQDVEILSLSATPIPRSLNFALAELKDFSIIATPPTDRLPVRTFLYSYNKNLINEAIQREVMRAGQTYYLCNDLKLIEDRKLRIKESFPNLNIDIVHGKLKPNEIEETMLNFNQGNIDVLLCSTIIESGIDVANANTLIVEEADKLGLAQLHQLRGRVGRGEKQAYSYFLKSKNIINRKKAQSRLQALIDTDSLAAGFLLALKDLEIRGAGEILGSSQSGVFDSIGLDLYTRLLKKATHFIKEGVLNFEELERTPEINLGLSSYIPSEYLPDLNQRLLMYNRISSAENQEKLKAIQIEMINRFGLFPEELKSLFIQNELKIEAFANNISKVNVKKEKIDIFYNGSDLSTTLINPKEMNERVKTITAVMQATGSKMNV
tara:strand:+ start:3028 stop:6012 length:2985 start_codon:yes stop_codon:yes gene_type:complete